MQRVTIQFHIRVFSVPLAVLLASTLYAGAARAQALPAASSQAEVNSNNPTADVTDPTHASLQGGTASVTLPHASLLAQVNDPPGVATQLATAHLSYYFQVVGGSPGDTVPVLISTQLHVTSSAYPTDASANIFTDGSGPSAASETLLVGDTPASPLEAAFSGNLSLTSQSGQLRQLTMNASVGEAFLSGGNGLATVDPYVYIDPSFPNASSYSIEVSPGVANTPTPEPAIAPLLAGLASLFWRRRATRRI